MPRNGARGGRRMSHNYLAFDLGAKAAGGARPQWRTDRHPSTAPNGPVRVWERLLGRVASFRIRGRLSAARTASRWTASGSIPGVDFALLDTVTASWATRTTTATPHRRMLEAPLPSCRARRSFSARASSSWRSTPYQLLSMRRSGEATSPRGGPHLLMMPASLTAGSPACGLASSPTPPHRVSTPGTGRATSCALGPADGIC